VVGVRRTAASTGGRWARLVLLLCTLVGLAAMHTLGHGGHDAAAHPAAHAAARHVAEPVIRQVVAERAEPVMRQAGGEHSGAVRAIGPVLGTVAGRVADCAGDGCGRVLASPAGPSGGHLPAWSVCLAVLTAFAVLLLVAVLARRRPVGGWATPAAPRVPEPRAPPPRPVGLRLAASVLRR
jgi:hypothetical protein